MKELLMRCLVMSCILLGASVTTFATESDLEANAETVNADWLIANGAIQAGEGLSGDDTNESIIKNDGMPQTVHDADDSSGGLHCQNAVVCQFVFK